MGSDLHEVACKIAADAGEGAILVGRALLVENDILRSRIAALNKKAVDLCQLIIKNQKYLKVEVCEVGWGDDYLICGYCRGCLDESEERKGCEPDCQKVIAEAMLLGLEV